MSDTIVEEKGPRTAASRVAGATPMEESIVENHYSRSHGNGRQEEAIERLPERRFSDGVLSKIDEIVAREAAKTPKVEEPVEAEAATAETPTDATPTDDKPAPEPAKPAAAPTTTTETPSSEEVVSLRAERDRILAANQKLVADLDAARKAPAVTPHKLLMDAADRYVDDPIEGLRMFLAASHGLSDVQDKRIDSEFKDLYTDLTSKVLDVTPDIAHQAKRDAARARQLLEREKRERKAEQTPAAQPDGTAEFIGNRLSAKASEFGEKFPLLMGMSEHLDGKKPHELLATIIKRETQTGRIPIVADDDAMITAAAKFVEDHYNGIAEKIGKAKPTQPSTAKPTTQPSTSASKEAPPKPAGRNLTSADASVAPATQPAPKTEEQRPKKFKNDKERREWALRRFDR